MRDMCITYQIQVKVSALFFHIAAFVLKLPATAARLSGNVFLALVQGVKERKKERIEKERKTFAKT